MEAIFCSYNRAKGGTLLPLRLTADWESAKADALVSPLLVATYFERGVETGVLVAARQQLENGAPNGSHVSGANLSVYIFRKKNKRWVYQIGKRNVIEDGSWGNPPGAQLVRLGEERFGLALNSGSCGQGQCDSGFIFIAISEPSFPILGYFSTGEDNGGACTPDPYEQKSIGIAPCFSNEGFVELFRLPNSAYHGLRITYQGTANDKKSFHKVVPKNESLCYRMVGSAYKLVNDPACRNYKPLSAVNKNKGSTTEVSPRITRPSHD